MSKMKERVLAEHEEKKKKEEAVTKQPVNTIQTIAEEKTPYMQNTAVRPQISTQTTAPEPPNKWNFRRSSAYQRGHAEI